MATHKQLTLTTFKKKFAKVREWIKHIIKDCVEFVDGEKLDLNNLDYKLIKP